MNLSASYVSLGTFAEAIEYCEKALTIKETILPSKHPDIDFIFHHLGQIYNQICEYKRANEQHKKDLLYSK